MSERYIKTYWYFDCKDETVLELKSEEIDDYNFFPIVGEMPDGKSTVAGVWEFYTTHGLPLNFIFDILRDQNYIPDWITLYCNTMPAVLKQSRALGQIREAIVDSYFGRDYADIVISRLEKIFYQDADLKKPELKVVIEDENGNPIIKKENNENGSEVCGTE
jgi:alanyl-tRNA synthetase